MKRLINVISVLWLFLCVPAIGQTVITGTVTSNEGVAQESVIITARHPADSTIVGYAFTNSKGGYTLRTNAPGDSILLVLSGFNLRTLYRAVPNRNGQADWKTTEESLVLKEVQIKAQKLWGSRDTLNYLVAAYMKEHDVTIGDVLKSLPGISIDNNGQISYQGVPISKFYIENMDVLQGRYNLATQGIKATDVATVQVLEHHEHVRALQDQTPPEAAAINLKLKKEKKGVWSGMIDARAGYDDEPLWNVSAQAMYFGKTHQHVIYGASANDDTRNVMMYSHYGGSGITQDIFTNVANPGTSPMGNSIDSKYCNVSANNLVKLNDSTTLHFNGQYGNEVMNLATYRRTTYMLPDGMQQLLVEDMSSHNNGNVGETTLIYEQNRSKLYVNNTFDLKGMWEDCSGIVAGGQKAIEQTQHARTLGVHDRFSMVYRTKKNGGFKYNSDNSFRSTPQRLSITPGVFAGFLNDSTDYCQTSQTGRINRFASYNDFSLVADIRRRHFTVVPTASANVEHVDIVSDIKADGVARDNTHGDMGYTNILASVGARFQYNYKDFSANMNIPVSLSATLLGGQSHTDDDRVKMFFNPSADLQWKLNNYWIMTASGGYGQSSTSWGMLYTAYVLSAYNSMSHFGGGIFDTESMSGRCKIDYHNIFSQVFCYLELTANRSQSDIVYGSYIDENSFSTTQMEYAPHHSTGYGANVSVRKDVDWLNLSMQIKGGHSISKGVYLRQSVLARNTSKSYSLGGRIALRPLPRITIEDNFGWSLSKSHNSLGYAGMDIKNFRNVVDLFLILKKQVLFLNAKEHHTMNTSLNGMRHFDMLDCSLRWKIKDYEIKFSVENILNNRQYVDRYETDMVNSYFMYELTPRRFMVGTVFHIK